MKTILTVAATLCSLMIAPSVLPEDTVTPPAFPKERTSSELREGVWVWRSGNHVSWMEQTQVLKIARKDDRWTISFFKSAPTRETVQKRQVAPLALEGSYPVSIRNGVLEIKHPAGVASYSCRFQGDLLQFPALVRLDDRTFNFTFSEVAIGPNGEKTKIGTVSHTWECASNRSEAPQGDATLTTVSPRDKRTIPLTYATEDHHDGPALVFRSKGIEAGKPDRFVWHQKAFGLQIYDSSLSRSLGFDLGHLQKTYHPADDALKSTIQIPADR